MITQWVANAPSTAQVEMASVTAVANGGQLIATINGKQIIYTCTASDTTTTAATNWYALLNAQTTPAEFQQELWANPSATNVTATARSPGTPFAGMSGGLVFSASGGAAVTQTALTPNSSPSDVADARNWLRNGLPSLPQDNDDLVVSDSSVGLLWNLNALSTVRLSSYTRYQNFTATIGLPQVNPLGYYEFRPTYLKLFGGGASASSSSPSAGFGSVLNVVLGFGGGTGPSRERYDFQGQQYNAAVLAAGTPADPYSILLLGSNSANTISNLVSTSVGVATLAAETANLASAQVGAGGLLSLGSGVTFTGTLTVTGGNAILNCAPAAVVAQDQSAIAQGTVASSLRLTYPSIILKNGSSATWLSGSNITALVLQTGSTFDKSRDVRSMTMGSFSIEVNSCILNDPYNAISFGSPVVLVNALQSGPFRFGPGRTATFT